MSRNRRQWYNVASAFLKSGELGLYKLPINFMDMRHIRAFELLAVDDSVRVIFIGIFGAVHFHVEKDLRASSITRPSIGKPDTHNHMPTKELH